ncbi:hypothetical protein NA57DRAFT_29427, partial [Rhizodiscina lignyota]
KPDPVGKPQVWADERQELCESLPYFRSYQGGCYANAPYVFGFMFDGGVTERDYTDSDVVIARAGGGRGEDAETGEVQVVKDQTDGTQAKSLQNNINNYNPVAIIAGAQNPTLRCKVQHTYNVLGWFKPTQIWHEKQPKTDIPLVRYRFEKLHPSQQSWWAPRGNPDPVELGQLDPPVSQCCSACCKESQQVYIQGWMCLSSTCEAFWKLSSGKEPAHEHLRYDPRFLKQKTVWPYTCEPTSLVPPLMQECDDDLLGHNFSRMAAMGAVCEKCGRCNSRIFWERWVCAAPGCDWTYPPQPAIIPANALVDFYRPFSTGFPGAADTVHPSIPSRSFFRYNYRIQLYIIPGCGFVAHLSPNRTALDSAGGPNDIFEELQHADIGLQRRTLSNSKVKGSRMSSFTMNFGMPYKFVAATSSMSFDDAPNGVLEAKTRMICASKLVIDDLLTEIAAEAGVANQEYEQFNECLALAYMEDQSINYHDDGEAGLGPTIATESYGAPGEMRLRMKAIHWNGVSKEGNLLMAEPKPGCKNYDRRLEMWKELEALKGAGRVDEVAPKASEFAKELKSKKQRKIADDAVKMHLGHGDIVIMHGDGVQKYYEHSVSHSGKLRFALTCRHIRAEHLKADEKPPYEVKLDTEEFDLGAVLGRV